MDDDDDDVECLVRSELGRDADELDAYEDVFLDQTDGLVLRELPLPDHLGRPGSHQHLLSLFSRCVMHERPSNDQITSRHKRKTAECGQNKNAPTSKVSKCTHFYQKRKPLSCLFTFGNKNKNFHLPVL